MSKFLRYGILCALLAVGPFSVSQAMGQFYFMGNPLIGEKAPDFKLKLLSGKETTLNEYREGKSAIVFFWATWCPHCREQLEVLNKKASLIEGQGIKIVLIDLGETEREVRGHLTKHNITLDVFLDQDSKVSDQYNLIGVPTFVFVDKDGVVKDVLHALPDDYETILKTATEEPKK